MEKFEINVEALGGFSEQEFFHFCQDNNHLRIEREATGKIIIMSPTGSKSGNRRSSLAYAFGLWNKTYQKGYFFDSAAGFTRENGRVHPQRSFFWLVD